MNKIFGINFKSFVTGRSHALRKLIFNPHSNSLSMFLTTYAISIFSAALGLAKCLKNGVARPIAPGGALDGFMTGKFLVALLASAGALVAKCVCIGFTVVSHVLYILSIISKH